MAKTTSCSPWTVLCLSRIISCPTWTTSCPCLTISSVLKIIFFLLFSFTFFNFLRGLKEKEFSFKFGFSPFINIYITTSKMFTWKVLLNFIIFLNTIICWKSFSFKFIWYLFIPELTAHVKFILRDCCCCNYFSRNHSKPDKESKCK